MISDKRPVRSSISRDSLLFRGVPKKYIDDTIDSFETDGDDHLEKIKQHVAWYLSTIDKRFDDGEGILLYGSNGVGKTLLASLIIKEAYLHRYSSRKATFQEYIQEYTRIWEAHGLEEKESLEEKFYSKYKAVEFLVLDELGKELTPKVSPGILEDCLRYRDEKNFPTIVLTNLDQQEILKRYGSSVISLLKGMTEPFKVTGLDHRGVNKHEEQ